MPPSWIAPRRLGPPLPTLPTVNWVVTPPLPTRKFGSAMVGVAVLPPLTPAPAMTCCVVPAARIWPAPVTPARRSKALPAPKLSLS